MYAKQIDYARCAVAIAFVLCGAGLVISANRADWMKHIGRRDATSWIVAVWIFGIAMQICLVATAGLIIESLFRRWKKSPMAWKDFALISVLSIASYAAMIGILYSMSDHSPRKGGPPLESRAT